jgi:hypothetical protein
MVARFAIVAACLLSASPVFAQAMNADVARRFVIGKLFAFNCFDGSRGQGRIYGDGSVIGTVQFGGNGPARSMWMPAGTLRERGGMVCATLKGMMFEPCFNLTRTSDQSFRGAVSGMGFAYCDFTRRNVTASVSPRPSRPTSLAAGASANASGTGN